MTINNNIAMLMYHETTNDNVQPNDNTNNNNNNNDKRPLEIKYHIMYNSQTMISVISICICRSMISSRSINTIISVTSTVTNYNIMVTNMDRTL